jgi:hypothetical protein
LARITMSMTDEQVCRAFAGGVYFISPEELLSHNSGCLIEGLRALNIPARANTARLTSRPISMPLTGVAEADILSKPFAGMSAVIIDVTHGNAFVPLESMRGGRLAYLTNSDVGVFCRIPEPYPLFSVHETAFAANGARRYPLAFGPTQSLIQLTEKRMSFAQRKAIALRNFRATLGQGVRALLDMTYVPRLQVRMNVDQTVVSPADYIAALTSSQVCLAYGGDFFSPIQTNPWFAEREPEALARHSFDRINATAMVLRWDSWRFWESLVAGCLTVHLDFQKYGLRLPVMPEPWVHYAPIDLGNISGSVDALMDRQGQWADIAEAGRAWAIEHYAPKATALRLLRQLL